MKDFWKNPAVKNYLVQDIFDIDEIVRRLGGCPNDEDYKIVRSYYYWEWQGNEDWEIVITTKEDYEKCKDNDEFVYRTDLNYKDFLDKFWFDTFEEALYGFVEPNEQLDFISLVNETFFTLSFEGQGKLFLRNVINGLNELSDDIKRFLINKDKDYGTKINKIQEVVINEYSGSYLDTKNKIIQHYKFIFPEIENNFSQNLDLLEIKSIPVKTKEPKNLIWYEIGKLIAIGDIEFKAIKGVGNQIYYKKTEYVSGLSLAEELNKVLNLKTDSLKSYINDTISGVMDTNRKNIFNSDNKIQKLILYCKENNHKPSDYLLEKLKELQAFNHLDN
ncbi:hypothetical protein NO004_530034 [Flavobacterium psychrophilum]|uniref:hypothetical protein n=1 Tax=Flavobacterium psychrophilum TaxID=96345 RepID=UPI000B7C11F2|nr:hypothetical protein [Flavobacterium psychrophilum]SNB29796.1 hypothetical protein NO004_530034 [Flavobacterium psychrophilum]